MNPNFRELGDAAFKPDETVDYDIASCLTCKYFLSYKDLTRDPAEQSLFGICLFPMMMIDETVGLGLICDFFDRVPELF